jgi:hypothetical protein
MGRKLRCHKYRIRPPEPSKPPPHPFSPEAFPPKPWLYSNPDPPPGPRPYDPKDPTTFRWRPRKYTRDVATEPLTEGDYLRIYELAALRVREKTIAHDLDFQFSGPKVNGVEQPSPLGRCTWVSMKESDPRDSDRAEPRPCCE